MRDKHFTLPAQQLKLVTRVLQLLTNLFPLWVVLCSGLALAERGWFAWFLPYITPGLAVIMLGMGLTLALEDFRRVAKTPRPIVAGCAAQFCLMPLLGWAVAHAVDLQSIDPKFAAGLILVACCPGGTASNVVCYLARANVALSVSMTMVSTFAAIALTPLLTKWLVGELVKVDLLKLFMDTLVVIVPVAVGLGLKQLAPKAVKRVEPVAPLVAVIVVVLIVAAIIELRAADIKAHWQTLLLAVCLLHGLAFLLGYSVARWLGFDRLIRRTVSIEVGMQNSGLGTHLAKNNPGFGEAAATPCALSAVMHCIFGSFCAALWRRDADSMDNPQTDAKLGSP